MTPERIAEIKSRLGELPQGAWRTRWEGQSFCVEDAEGTEVMEYVFAIPTWEPEYEAAKATCDVAVPTFVAHARQDVPDLCDALAAAQERIAALDAAAGMLANTVALLNSMIRSGEDHSPTSERVMRESLDAYGAALAGSQGGGGETRQDVACTETVHRVQEGADACDCGENRMELML